MGEIRASPYEKGLYFVSPEPGTTLQSIGMTEWNIGTRYTLDKVLGYGSNSCVCLATDTTTGEKVALKRVGDVLHSPDTAKRVLREVCILRRVSHPNVIGIRDCFVRPSATGQCRMIGGKLVNISLDLYIAMEFADGGDLFHMRGQLSPEEVKSLTWQLLQALNYLHSLDLWHRDVKSQNAFISMEGGLRIVKLGDFGSARSAIQRQRSIHLSAELVQQLTLGKAVRADSLNHALPPLSATDAALLAERAGSIHHVDSYMYDMELDAAVNESNKKTKLTNDNDDESRGMHSDIYANANAAQYPDVQQEPAFNGGTNNSNNNGAAAGIINNNSPSRYRTGAGHGFKAPLTRVVATPCYRAPEVVMSRGGYTAAIDTWSVGCIFGELLQRVAYVGSASTPHLAVAPLFAIKGMFKTPNGEESFGKPESLTTRRELQALFDVVGTPSWRDAASVPLPEWRRYLERLPGKAPTLYRRFAAAGEPAIHLLARLLEFDPDRRILCEEAMAHEYFADLRAELDVYAQQEGVADGVNTNNTSAHSSMMDIEAAATAGPTTNDMGEDDLLKKAAGSILDMIPKEVITAAMQHDANMSQPPLPVASSPPQQQQGTATIDLAPPQPQQSTESGAITPTLTPAPSVASPTSKRYRKYWEEPNPGKALALLEESLAACISSRPEEYAPASEGYNSLREMLERECEAIARSHGGSGASPEGQTKRPQKKQQLRSRNTASSLSTMLRSEGLVPDAGAAPSSVDPGHARLSNVADTWQGNLDPSKYLGAARHREWSSQSGTEPAAAYKTGGDTYRWGVSSIPPGADTMDPKIAEIVRKQQTR